MASERSTGSTYVQYALTKVTANPTHIMYDCCPNDPYPVMTFTFHIMRTTQMFAMLLVPLGFLTFLVNFAFFMRCDDNNRACQQANDLLRSPTPRRVTHQEQ